MSFSENIRMFRTVKGWSQENFAGEIAKTLTKKKGGSFAKSVSQWESNGVIPPMETCIAIAELMELTLDDLFNKEVQDFKCNYLEQVSGKRKFKGWNDRDIEIFYHVLQDLLFEKVVATDGTVLELFSSVISIDAKSEEKAISLYLKLGDILLEEKIENPDGYNRSIEKWLQTKILKYFFDQKMITDISVHSVESNFIAQIYLDLEDSDIKDLFVERALRNATDTIAYAKEQVLRQEEEHNIAQEIIKLQEKYVGIGGII